MNRSRITSPNLGVGCLILFASLVFASCSAEHAGRIEGVASNPHAAHAAQLTESRRPDEQKAMVVLNDDEMRDQTGAIRNLKSDVVGSRIVVVDFIFTSCQTICPVTTSLLADAHRRVSDISPSELAFVSLSVDANTDTPERLRAFAGRHKADWTFLTGDRQIMESALIALNSYATNPEDHTAMILIGDAATGEFVRVFGLPDPAFVETRVRQFVAARATSAGHHQH